MHSAPSDTPNDLFLTELREHKKFRSTGVDNPPRRSRKRIKIETSIRRHLIWTTIFTEVILGQVKKYVTDRGQQSQNGGT